MATEKQTTTANFANLGNFRVEKYKEAKGLSRETTAFSANLMLNNQKVGVVTNDGQGGSHQYNFENRAQGKVFNEIAEMLFPGIESSDRLFDELAVRYEMVAKIAPREVKRNRPVVVLIRNQAEHLGSDYVYFNEESFGSCTTMKGAHTFLEKNKPQEYVIYDSTNDTFTAARYTPDAETIRRIEEDERRRSEEVKLRDETWTTPEAIENCPRFQTSRNQAAKLKIIDTQSGREAVVRLYAANDVTAALVGLFGAEKTEK